MGSQALGAAVGGLVASVVGLAPRHRRGAGRRRRLQPLVRGHHTCRRQAPRRAAPPPTPAPCPSGPGTVVASSGPSRADTVVDLVAMEAPNGRRPAAGEPPGRRRAYPRSCTSRTPPRLRPLLAAGRLAAARLDVAACGSDDDADAAATTDDHHRPSRDR